MIYLVIFVHLFTFVGFGDLRHFGAGWSSLLLCLLRWCLQLTIPKRLHQRQLLASRETRVTSHRGYKQRTHELIKILIIITE